MNIAIIGGKLQGTEAVLLSKLAGYKSLLIDKDKEVPAATLCDEFVCGNLVNRDSNVIAALKKADIILPAMENFEVIDAVIEIANEHNIPIAFDKKAYYITASKIDSDTLMENNGIRKPEYYPKGKPPYIAKPSCGSGSDGVVKLSSKKEVELFIESHLVEDNWIIEEFVEGPSYSVEVIGEPSKYRVYQPTKIHMDSNYDCCKVSTPIQASDKIINDLYNIAIKLANMVDLHGIMDVEVIERNGELFVLEIDARIPSQTPLAVYFSTGVNELEDLIDITLKGEFIKEWPIHVSYASYEQYVVDNSKMLSIGEHVMSDAGHLGIQDNRYGADFLVSNLSTVTPYFRGIFITKGASFEELNCKREKIINNLNKALKDYLNYNKETVA